MIKGRWLPVNYQFQYHAVDGDQEIWVKTFVTNEQISISGEYHGIVGLSPCPEGLGEYSMEYQFGVLLEEKQINTMNWNVNAGGGGGSYGESIRGNLSINEDLNLNRKT